MFIVSQHNHAFSSISLKMLNFGNLLSGPHLGSRSLAPTANVVAPFQSEAYRGLLLYYYDFPFRIFKNSVCRGVLARRTLQS